MDRLFRDLLARHPDGPDAEAIADGLRRAIAARELSAGDRLPTIRAAAEHLEVPRAVVQLAYRMLADDRIVRATVGRGTEVLKSIGDGMRDAGPGSRASAVLARLGEVAEAIAEAPPPGSEVVADLRELLPDPDAFPVPAFAEAIARVLADNGCVLLDYGDPQGDPGLREWLGRDDDSGREIVVTSGAQHGIDLVLRTIMDPGQTVVAACPTYSQLPGALAANGVGLRTLPWRTDGFDVAALDELCREDASVRVLYVMPSFQNPTGITLDLDTRRGIVAVCERHGVAILEDEFQGGLRFAGEDLPKLGDLAPDRTATVRTFSKGLFPGVRLGWVSAPAEWVVAMTAMRRFVDLETSPLMQAAVLEFGRAGHVDAHRQRMCDELRRRHARAQQALAEHMPKGVGWTRPEGGYALWLDLPDGVSAEEVARRAARDRVFVTTGSVFDPERDSGERGLRLSLSRTPVDAIDEAVRVLASHVRPASRLATPVIL